MQVDAMYEVMRPILERGTVCCAEEFEDLINETAEMLAMSSVRFVYTEDRTRLRPGVTDEQAIMTACAMLLRGATGRQAHALLKVIERASLCGLERRDRILQFRRDLDGYC